MRATSAVTACPRARVIVGSVARRWVLRSQVRILVCGRGCRQDLMEIGFVPALRWMMPPPWCRAGVVRACAWCAACHLAPRASGLGVFGPAAHGRSRTSERDRGHFGVIDHSLDFDLVAVLELWARCKARNQLPQIDAVV